MDKKDKTEFSWKKAKEENIKIQFPKSLSESINRMNAKLNADLHNIQQQMDKAMAPLIESIESIKQIFPEYSEYSEEELARIDTSWETWGRYGWGYFPGITPAELSEPPLNKKDATYRMRAYCTDSEVEEILSDLRLRTDIDLHDLEEAICHYKNKQYKGCISILFSLVDAKILNFQAIPEFSPPEGQRREVGKRGLKAATSSRKGESIKNKGLIPNRWKYKNVIVRMEVFWENAHDFKHQPLVTNRNFIMHGMYKKKILKKDCIQLFLLLSNLCDLLDTIIAADISNT